jgi:hypothetical protein
VVVVSGAGISCSSGIPVSIYAHHGPRLHTRADAMLIVPIGCFAHRTCSLC